MRKRYQRGSVVQSSDGRYWVGKYREDGRHKSKSLGNVGEISKSRAQELFEEFRKPSKEPALVSDIALSRFIETVYFPFYMRKWKRSTLMTNQDRIRGFIVPEFGARKLRSFTRDELQDFLDSKSKKSYSTVAHLRWDLRQIFQMAVTEGIIIRNPAALLFTPRECSTPEHPTMTAEQVRLALSVLELRDRLIVKLAIFAGLRPGEIFALRRDRLVNKTADIRERIYRGHLDTPKTRKSRRVVTLSDSVWQDVVDWIASSPTVPEGWLFPSENVAKPLWKDNALYRYIRPKLQSVNLGWIDFQVMRRTYSTLMRERGVDPKIVADLMGHDVDVNLNTYTQTSLESRFEAVKELESTLIN